MATPESKVKNKAKLALARLGAYYTFPMTGGYSNSGVPDILVCYRGIFIGLECKANGNKPTRLQESHIKEINMNGGIAFIVDEHNIDNLYEFLKERVDEHINANKS
jgi:hypothetical protein